MFTTDHLSAYEAACLLRAVGLELTRRVEHRLPGITETFARHAVIQVDGVHVVGLMGSYKSPAWTLEGEHFDKITIAVHHVSHQAVYPHVYAQNILCTLAHEIAHAYLRACGVDGTSGPGRVRHTDAFARVAIQLGLHVEYRPDHPTAIFTPTLSIRSELEFADLVDRIAAAKLSRTSDVGYSGPDRFHELVARASTSSSLPSNQ